MMQRMIPTLRRRQILRNCNERDDAENFRRCERCIDAEDSGRTLRPSALRFRSSLRTHSYEIVINVLYRKLFRRREQCIDAEARAGPTLVAGRLDCFAESATGTCPRPVGLQQ